ncbi:hypothetical protein ABPG74_012299 [Tetrahymena malaccensis]
MNLNPTHEIQFKYQQTFSKNRIELISINVRIKVENLLSNAIYSLKYDEIIESLQNEDIICNNGMPISYEKEGQSSQINDNEFIEINLDLNSQVTHSQITFKDAGLGLQNKLKQQDQMIQYLQQQINEINEKLSKSQNNQVHRSLDILFLIGMPKKDNQHDVSCEKEIMKIQTILYQNKIKCSISIAKTKESFKEMLSLNPQIIHVICHGQRSTDAQSRHIFNLEIEDQKGEQQAITGQQLMNWIRKSNCNPCLIILNACYSQGIYEDMLRIQNNKFFNTLAINSEFQIDDKFAYKFVMLFYRKFISEMKQNNSKSQDKKNTTNQKENKIPWLKIIEDTKQYINRNQLQEMVQLKSLCCKGSNFCEFLQQNKNYQNCDCFKEQRNINFEVYQAKHQNLVKGLTNQEFNYLKQFVQLHNVNCQNYKIGKYLVNNRKYSFLLCTRGNQIKDLKKSQLWKRFQTSIEKSQDQSQEAIFLITMNFLKQMFLEGERFIFNQQKNSSNPIFAFQDPYYQQDILKGPDFLTNNYPKFARSKDISDIEKTLQKNIQKCQKDFSLNQNYYEQSKGKVLKYLTDIQSKSADYKSQIHILNISGINTMDEFKKIFLLDFKYIEKNIKGQNDSKINLFYLYNWKKSDKQLNFIKGKQQNIQLYIQNEKENDYDSLLFYSFTIKDINHLIKNLPNDEIETIMNKFKLNQKQIIDYLNYCQHFKQNIDYENTDLLFKELIKQKSSQGIQTVGCMFQYTIEQINNLFAQKNNENLTNLQIEDKSKIQTIVNNTQIQQPQTKSFEDMNRFLLNLIDPEEFVQNKQLYKYLLKNIKINCTSCHKIIQKKSLTKCLLKQILQNCSISKEKLDLLYLKPNKQINIQSLKGILNFLNIEYSEIVPQLREVAKYIILNELLPLNTKLVKSYIVEIDFENKFHKEFRDIIKIHKRILIEKKKKINEQEQRDLEEVEYILDYLKVKYYNKIARINHKNQNLYYLSTMKAEINYKNSSRLFMMIQSRNIIRTISYIGFKKSSLNDIDSILYLYKKFIKFFNKISEKKQRQQSQQSPKIQNLNFNNKLADILISSTLLKELLQFLNKAQMREHNYVKQSEENLSISTDRQKYFNIIKNSVQKLRTMYREFQSQYSDNSNIQKQNNEKQQIQQIQISFSAYYELELLIEQIFHEMKNTNLTNKIIQFSNIQLNCQEFYEIFKKSNEIEIQNIKINPNLIHNFHDSFLFIQYYFKCPKECSHTLINQSLSIKKNITENIYNRLIFTTKLFTKSNIEQIQKIQEFQKLKKVIIIDQEETNHFDKYEILDLENLNTQKNQPILKYAQQVELLIILNSSESYDLLQSVFKEKWVLCINKQNMNIHEQQNLVMSLLQNIIKSDKVNFPLALQKSLSSIIKEDLQNQISFKCFSKENIEISNLCYSNNDKSLNEYTAIEDITQQEDINNYLETQKNHSQIDLLDIFGKQSTKNFTIIDTNFFSFNFQEQTNIQSLELQNTDSFPNTFPQPSQLENNLQQSHQNDEEDEGDTIYSSQIQTERNILSYTKDKKY